MIMNKQYQYYSHRQSNITGGAGNRSINLSLTQKSFCFFFHSLIESLNCTEHFPGFSEFSSLLSLIQPKISTFFNNSPLQIFGCPYFLKLCSLPDVNSEFLLFSLSLLFVNYFDPCFYELLC